MSRDVQTITIENPDSRDNGKTYIVTAPDAEAAEWWAFRVLQALAANSADIDLTKSAPLAELARAGIHALAKVPPQVAKPLFDEMLQYVAVRLPDGNARPLLKGDIQEVMTRFELRKAFLELMVGFFTFGSR